MVSVEESVAADEIEGWNGVDMGLDWKWYSCCHQSQTECWPG
jgi:hypothetical protein